MIIEMRPVCHSVCVHVNAISTDGTNDIRFCRDEGRLKLSMSER